jgi:hypothetical protein
MVRWSEAELARFLRHGPGVPLTEKSWQQAVTRLLHQHGYHLVYHTYDSRRSPSGFPDVCALHEQPGHPLLALELKTDTGQITPAQAAWLAAMETSSGIRVGVYRPRDVERLVEMLQR